MCSTYLILFNVYHKVVMEQAEEARSERNEDAGAVLGKAGKKVKGLV